jgi:hypothetical protein
MRCADVAVAGNENMIVDMDNYAALSPPEGIRAEDQAVG